MALIRPSEPTAMTADDAARRNNFGYAARSELALRNALEAWCRTRFPEARVVHELVMGEGRVRADVVAIGTTHIAAFEVKGSYDDTTRLLHQVGMFQLCVPEVWMVVAVDHGDDAKLIRHLLPSVGLITAPDMDRGWARRDEPPPITLTVAAEAVPRPVVPEMALAMLWADELRGACAALRVSVGAKATRTKMIEAIMAVTGSDEITGAICTQLRRRDAVWRADPPDGLATPTDTGDGDE